MGEPEEAELPQGVGADDHADDEFPERAGQLDLLEQNAAELGREEDQAQLNDQHHHPMGHVAPAAAAGNLRGQGRARPEAQA